MESNTPNPSESQTTTEKRTPEILREKATEIFADLTRFAREHRDLSRRNYEEFVAKHRTTVEDLRTRAQKAVPKEQVQARVREVNDVIEKRLETLRTDLEKRYDEVEREIEQTVERVFGTKPDAPTVEVQATTDASGASGSESANGATPKKAKKAAAGNN